MEARVIRLPTGIRPFLRITWFFVAALVLGLFMLSVPAQLVFIARAARENVMAVVVSVAISLTQSAGPLISLALAGVLYFKRPNDGMALFLSYFLLIVGVFSIPFFLLEPIWPGYDSFISGAVQPLVFGPFLIAFL